MEARVNALEITEHGHNVAGRLAQGDGASGLGVAEEVELTGRIDSILSLFIGLPVGRDGLLVFDRHITRPVGGPASPGHGVLVVVGVVPAVALVVDRLAPRPGLGLGGSEEGESGREFYKHFNRFIII